MITIEECESLYGNHIWTSIVDVEEGQIIFRCIRCPKLEKRSLGLKEKTIIIKKPLTWHENLKYLRSNK